MSECVECEALFDRSKVAFEVYELAVRRLKNFSGAERSEKLKKCVQLFEQLLEARNAMHGHKLVHGCC